MAVTAERADRARGVAPVREELASVVVAAGSEHLPARPWYVTLRPWLFCLLFLTVFELGTRAAYDRTECLHHQRFDNFPGVGSEAVWVDQLRRDPAYRVVVIGDSVVVGASLLPPDQTVPECLEREIGRALPGRPIHVWNFGIAGARSTDQLCLLTKVLEARPDLVVISSNYITYQQSIQDIPMAAPWLARNLREVPECIGRLLPRRAVKIVIDDATSDFFERNLRLVGMRQDINARLFGIQPRSPFESPNPVIMAAATAGKRMGRLRMLPWNRRGLTAAQFRGLYTDKITADRFNGQYYRYILDALHRSSTPAITYVTPQNPEFIEAYMSRDRYMENRRVLCGFLRDPSIPTYDLSDLLPSSSFYDNDHLMPEGNQVLAQALARRIAPIVQADPHFHTAHS